MKKYIVLFLVLGAFLFTTSVSAWECEYGTVNAWVKLAGDAQWREAMVDGVTLKVHEPFKVKVQVTTKTACDVYTSVYDPGVTKVFEVVGGPSKNGEDIDEYNCPSNWTKTYEWTVRPTGKWTDGWAPWNIGIIFMKTQDDYKYIDKTIIHAYISSEEWKEEYEKEKNLTQDQNGENKHRNLSTNSFALYSIVGIIVFVALFILWRRRAK